MHYKIPPCPPHDQCPSHVLPLSPKREPTPLPNKAPQNKSPLADHPMVEVSSILSTVEFPDQTLNMYLRRPHRGIAKDYQPVNYDRVSSEDLDSVVQHGECQAPFPSLSLSDQHLKTVDQTTNIMDNIVVSKSQVDGVEEEEDKWKEANTRRKIGSPVQEGIGLDIGLAILHLRCSFCYNCEEIADPQSRSIFLIWALVSNLMVQDALCISVFRCH